MSYCGNDYWQVYNEMEFYRKTRIDFENKVKEMEPKIKYLEKENQELRTKLNTNPSDAEKISCLESENKGLKEINNGLTKRVIELEDIINKLTSNNNEI